MERKGDNQLKCRWIPVGEKMPPRMTWILGFGLNKHFNCYAFEVVNYDGEFWNTLHIEPTHWMPLPSCPPVPGLDLSRIEHCRENG
jgi:Protein of unknown function (DUF551)